MQYRGSVYRLSFTVRNRLIIFLFYLICLIQYYWFLYIPSKKIRILTTWMVKSTLCEKCANAEFFVVRVFPWSDWIRENTDQKKLRILDTSRSASDPILSLVKRLLLVPDSVLKQSFGVVFEVQKSGAWLLWILSRSRSSYPGCSINKVILWISQNSQEITCARVSF